MKRFRLLGLSLRYFKYLWPYNGYLLLGLVMIIYVTLLDLAAPWPLKFIVDNVIGGKPFADPVTRWIAGLFGKDLWRLSGFFVSLTIIFAVLDGVFSFTWDYLLGMVQARTCFLLRSDAFAHLQRLSLQFHDRVHTGEIVSRVNSDAGQVMEALAGSTGELTANLLRFVGIVGIMFFVNRGFSVIALAFAPFLFLTFIAFRRNIKASARQARREAGEMASITTETISAIRIVKAFGREADEQDRFDRHGVARLQAELRGARWEAALEPMVDLFKAIGAATITLYGVSEILEHRLSIGELLVFLSYLSSFFSPIKRFTKLASVLQKAMPSAERLYELLDNDQVMHDRPGALALARARGEVEFRSVYFAYEQDTPILENISFTVPPGWTVGLVGRTGTGKTTIANLLLRFYDVTSGCILIDGVDIRTIRLEDYRRQIALVPQEPILFATSIRDNITYGRPGARMSDIIAAARAANAHDFISRLSNGYETVIGERGVTLSGGQRQRVAIARAILCDPPILILDEPTSSLDAGSEREVLGGLEQMMLRRTNFVIAHRLSTIRDADLILVLENGSVLERGTHTQLMRMGGVYAKMVSLQNGPNMEPSHELVFR